MSKPHPLLAPNGAEPALELSSGHRVVLAQGGEAEAIEVRSPEGRVELTITLTPEGPVVRMSGARLEMEATDALALKARTVEVVGTESASVQTDGQLTLASGLDTRAVAQGEMHLLGSIIWLN